MFSRDIETNGAQSDVWRGQARGPSEASQERGTWTLTQTNRTDGTLYMLDYNPPEFGL